MTLIGSRVVPGTMANGWLEQSVVKATRGMYVRLVNATTKLGRHVLVRLMAVAL